MRDHCSPDPEMSSSCMTPHFVILNLHVPTKKTMSRPNYGCLTSLGGSLAKSQDEGHHIAHDQQHDSLRTCDQSSFNRRTIFMLQQEHRAAHGRAQSQRPDTPVGTRSYPQPKTKAPLEGPFSPMDVPSRQEQR